ncbi:hypoxanthine phosphoribosyltransferase [bacterium]|nr:hypoxanthine phosphoribosyltransferase [bacterium]
MSQSKSLESASSTSPLFTELQIRHRTAELAQQIANDYRGKDVIIAIVLKGAFMFASDLLRRLFDAGLTPGVDFLRAQSYHNKSESSGTVEVNFDLSLDVKGKSLLLVDDIIDTGLTLAHLDKHIKAKGALEVRSCVLLDKPSKRVVEYKPDYTGFIIENLFVVGYGLDYAESFRYLPYITIVDVSD